MELRSAQRIEFLDSIRGLAALSVLLSHAAGLLVIPAWLTHVMEFPLVYSAIDGKAAVAMFFVLSGFVLSRPYLKRSANTPVRPLLVMPFYLKRITRIYIPFFVALTLSAVVNIWFFRRYETIPPQSGWFMKFWSEPWTAHDFLKQCAFMLHDGDRQLMNQDWSLGVELKASALLPFFLFAVRRNPVWLALIGVLLFSLVGTGHYYVGFVLGMFLAIWIERWMLLLNGKPFVFKCLLLLAGLLLYGTRNLLLTTLHFQLNEKWVWFFTSLGCVLIVLSCFGSRRIQKGLNQKFILFLGRISYGVYLLQFIFLLALIPWLIHQFNSLGIEMPILVWLLTMSASVVVTVLAGAIFFHLVEKPSIQLGHALTSSHAPRSEPTAKVAPSETTPVS